MQSLAVKYRPKRFEDVCSQKAIIKILNRQIELKQFVNCYLFSGPSGCGKTTIARIFASKLNDNLGTPIEIDAASNNGVDNIRNIIASAKERALDSKYKVFIVDEAHMITTQGWNAFLKCIEEPPELTIFIFCTTDPQKIPETILNRVMQFKLSKIPYVEIEQRIKLVCSEEGLFIKDDGAKYLAQLSKGGMRDALALLDKCSGYSNELSLDNIIRVLGTFSYVEMINLTNNIIDDNETSLIKEITHLIESGADIKKFVDTYLDFILDLNKYILFNDISVTGIPYTIEKDVKYTTAIEGSKSYFSWLLDKILNIKNAIKLDSNCGNTVMIMLLQCARGK